MLRGNSAERSARLRAKEQLSVRKRRGFCFASSTFPPAKFHGQKCVKKAVTVPVFRVINKKDYYWLLVKED
ncbi:hypothetical protein HMPREF3293_01202 [Christensenella minuta]|uniref:Uncharacterized protein n=1 Tax=Christensenella minuta TaxID=626937 RepID=A0A136Q5I5_9FIRM|nr:hypothetical protein HMPREF3293_01202 [Christensenella minuta]